jgi:hypothetical protein
MPKTTEIIKDGPGEFWSGVRYFYDQPKVGLVAVRGLLTPDEVAEAREAGNAYRDLMRQEGINKPNTLAIRLAECILLKKDIDLFDLRRANNLYWDPSAENVDDLRNDIVSLTEFGKSQLEHVDTFVNGNRPIGVSVSISIGRATFASSLPPLETRTKVADPDNAAYRLQRDRAIRETADFSVDLEPGDAAIWLQPGVHMARTTETDRFAVISLTAAPQNK